MTRWLHHISLLGWKDGTAQAAVNALGVELERMAGLDDPAAVGCYRNAARQLLEGQRAGPGQPVPDRPSRNPLLNSYARPRSPIGGRPNWPAACRYDPIPVASPCGTPDRTDCSPPIYASWMSPPST